MAVEFVLWRYTPSLVISILFTFAFGSLSLTHLILRARKGAKFMNCVIVGGIFEAIGYGARAAAHYNTDSKMAYAIQSLFILLGPILFAASTYMVLGRIIIAAGDQHLSPVPMRLLTKLFVAGDVLCFTIQAGGGAILSSAKSQSTLDLGNYVILAGLIIQVLIFSGFIVCAVVYQVRAQQQSANHRSSYRLRTSSRWIKSIATIYIVSVLIMTRNVYRILEYVMGSDGYLQSHEWVLYVFDGALMVAVMVICLWWHNGFLQEDGAEATQKERGREFALLNSA